MAHQNPSSSTTDYGSNLDKRLADLDEVDRKVGELLESTKEIICNLEKDKQISKNKMDEAVKKFSRTLEEDIFRVISDQLNYMEQLCVGSEHQGSLFKPRNSREVSRRSLQLLHEELEYLVPSRKSVPEEPKKSESSEKESDESSFEDVVSGTSEDVYE